MTTQAVGGLVQAAQQAMSGQVQSAIQACLAALKNVAPSAPDLGQAVGSALSQALQQSR